MLVSAIKKYGGEIIMDEKDGLSVEDRQLLVEADMTMLLRILRKHEVEIRNLKLALECVKPVEKKEETVSFYV